MLVDKSNKVPLKCIAVPRLDCFAEDVVRFRPSTKVPAPKGDDFLHCGHFLEEAELPLDLTDVDVEVFGHLGKGEVYLRVAIGIDLVDIHGQTLTVVVPGLKIGDVDLLRGWLTFDKVPAAVAHA